MTSGIIIVIIIQLIQIAFLYLKPYISEKGKNLATKEDIGEIQNSIEKVRTEHSKQIELIKGSIQLDILANQHFLEKSTQIMLEFYDDIVILNWEYLTKSLADVLGEDFKKAVVEHTQNTIRKFTKITVDYHRVLIFLDGQEELGLHCAKVAQTIKKLEKAYVKHVGALKFAAVAEQEAYGTSNYMGAVQKHNNVIEDYYKDINPIRETLNIEMIDFIDKLMAYFRLKKIVT
ncbi:MAG TPA: hypothetical protein VIM89_23505 [Mucilaginibacter sp.]